MSVSRPCLPDEEPFGLEFEPSLNVLQDNMIHGMQNNHSDDNFRRPDFGKEEIFDNEFKMYEEAQQEMQINNDHGESDLAHSDQSFEDICNEEIRIFEELELVINSKCFDSYLELSCAGSVPRPRLPDEEPFELEFEPSLNVLQDLSLIHI